MNPIPLLSFNRKASEAVWQFTLLHVSEWLGKEICFWFQVSIVLAVLNAVQSHIQARGSPAQSALAVSLVMESSPFASPFPCWRLLSKHEHLPSGFKSFSRLIQICRVQSRGGISKPP